MGKEHNISKANRQLGDTTYFKRLDQDPTSDLQRLLKEKLTEMLASKEISEDNIEYLTVANPRAGRFYLPLPKIHKPGNPACPIVDLHHLALDYHRMSKISPTFSSSYLQATYPKRHGLPYLMLCP